MIITLSWLKDHLSTNANLEKIIDKLTGIGLEVEGIKDSQGGLSNFKVAKVLKAEKHPNADKLKLCDVSLGNGKTIKVVCGAANARAGLVSIYAPPGSVIPKTKLKLKIAKIRGVESHGMLCSESELNLSDESDGIIELKNREKDIGKNYFKSKGEKSIDVSITPNRPDCLGVRGIARDLASAGLGRLSNLKKTKIKQNFSQPMKISITKEKNQGCMSFGACYIRNIKNKESPTWLKEKIISLGLKPISAVVDITNYVMLDLNRPLHAYDADKVDKEIIVRNSKPEESFEALDGKQYKLKKNMCVISDRSGPLGLGGIIGGTRSGTELDTKNILLEAAYFYPSSVRKTSNILDIDTDAKYRFERGIDPNSITEGLELATDLIIKICGGQASKFSITGKPKVKNRVIEIDNNKFKKVIGIPISSVEAKKILTSLGFKVKVSKKSLKVEIPTWRPDVNQDIDIIEELIRIKGFDKISLVDPERKRSKDTLNFKQKLFHLSQRAVANKGYLEAVTWSFTDSRIDKQFSKGKKEIEITNPISSDLNVLRRSIFSNLIIYLKKNQDRGYPDISLFEIGPIFSGNKPGEQQVVLGGLKSGVANRKSWDSKARNIDVFDVKADAIKTLIELGIEENDLHISNQTEDYYNPVRSGSVKYKSANGSQLAFFGEIHPAIVSNLDFKEQNVCGFEIFLKNIPEPKKKYRLIKRNYSVSEFQKSERDFAFIIDKNYKAGDVEKIISEVDNSLIQKVLIFDVFEGGNMPEGKKSIAINVTIQSMEKTLSEKDINDVSQKIINIVKAKTGGTIRS
jgi:phenylalanyl-tRNA synthetase beta chain